jgi:hypothetical protein
MFSPIVLRWWRRRRAALATPPVEVPVNEELPEITGNLYPGETLTVSNGTWTNEPTSYAYQWKKGGTPIIGATSNTYVAQVGDGSAAITADVTASNAGGDTTATSAGVTIIENTVLPGVTSSATIGTQNNGMLGTWTGSPVITHQWQRNTGSWVDISGATSLNYTPVDVDFGYTLRRREIPNGDTGAAVASAATAAVGKVVATITPTIGAERLTNTGFETLGAGGADVFANWIEAVGGTSTVNAEGTDVHTGSRACRFDVDATNGAANVRQGGLTAHSWFQFSARLKASSGTPRAAVGTSLNLFKPLLSTSYQLFTGTQRTASGTEAFFHRSDGSASKSIYVDEVSAKPLTFSTTHTLLGTRTTRSGTYTCHPTLSEFLQVGMLISYADDSNFVMMFLDHSGDQVRAKLQKCIAGVYSSELLAISVTYGAGKALACMVNGTSYSLFYDNVQVGTTQTISDVSLGLEVHAFSTSPLNEVGLATADPDFS